MAGEPAPTPAGTAAEPERLLALAESALSVGRLRAAHKHASRAALLDPASPRAALLATAANVLVADPASHYAVLLLPDDDSASPLSASALHRHFKSLVKSLRVNPQDSATSPAVKAAVEEALGRAAEAYEALTAPPPAPALDTFWTACAGCRLLHEFERKYVGYRLMCPSCHRIFLATEIPPPPEAGPPTPALRPAEEPETEKPEMTLAEIKLELAKKRGAKASKKRSSRGEVEQEDGEEVEAENNHSDLMAVVDSDFYNFDADRGERCFKRGQLWALYSDDDGMPRYYALVEGVLRGSRFRIQIRWLDGGEEGKPCGQFKVGSADTLHSVNVFSHLVACERVAREVYRVYPRKASVWAFHGDQASSTGRGKYEIVVFLSGYSEQYGASFGYLEKVQGFRSIFKRRDVGAHAVQSLQKGDIGALSHQIPAKKVSKGEGSALPPGDCWELDPASLPPELLRLEPPRK
ncbi:uncharacterized protein LOC120671050 [Panicum virgatum]|uniref:J domain-containing protein n=1 Tax=Panicum virgatum TaxID=38727 RepID=A0A8T0SY42_PANVG|nr:uncharacterized protein LOC120671050 [Panicum virgatum]KAG2603769.1 hypothetical protein PVAP13_4NG010700 [Panicum virgatum]KAG2603770.1 hypothetical protein PVAP13_4NG010700 [Panicum virgatum]